MDTYLCGCAVKLEGSEGLDDPHECTPTSHAVIDQPQVKTCLGS